MEDEKRVELCEDSLEQISGGTAVGLAKRQNSTSKVWCAKCKDYVEVSTAGSGGRTKCSRGKHYIDEL